MKLQVPKKNLPTPLGGGVMLSPSLRWRAFGQCSNQSASVVIERDGWRSIHPRSPRSAITLGAHRGSLSNTTTRTPSAEPPTGVKHLRRRRRQKHDHGDAGFRVISAEPTAQFFATRKSASPPSVVLGGELFPAAKANKENACPPLLVMWATQGSSTPPPSAAPQAGAQAAQIARRQQ